MTTKKLTIRQKLLVAGTLFGMFFGAGNLIFPVHLGQMAGRNAIPAMIGFIITAVGIPVFGVAAIGITHSDGLQTLAGKVSKGYGIFFTCLLYLTIGPLFAIPRCATVSFTTGVAPMLGDSGTEWLYLLIFSAVFFAFVLFFSLRPGKILTWVGKILNPFFLLFLGILVVVTLVSPAAVPISSVEPMGGYIQQPFLTGFLEGYNTMDALASLAFGIIVVQVIRELGVDEPGAVARNTAKAGIFSCLFMGLIYVAVTAMSAKSRGVLPAAENGGVALAQISQTFLGRIGLLILAVTVTLACLKTAVGLITSCSETFTGLFPKGPAYRVWAVIFTLVSLIFANFGLSAIIDYAVPVLMFLYPLAIVLILLALFGKFFSHDKKVYNWVISLTLISALYDLLRTLPAALRAACHLDGIIEAIGSVLPLAGLGLGWICPAAVGLVIGLVAHSTAKAKKQTA